MATLVIKLAKQDGKATCGLCARKYPRREGPELFLAGNGRGACPACGKVHAPRLAALLELARAAESVGHFSQLARWLPLAHAAHEYTSAISERESA